MKEKNNFRGDLTDVHTRATCLYGFALLFGFGLLFVEFICMCCVVSGELTLRLRPLIRRPYSWMLVQVWEILGCFGPHIALGFALLLLYAHALPSDPSALLPRSCYFLPLQHGQSQLRTWSKCFVIIIIITVTITVLPLMVPARV